MIFLDINTSHQVTNNHVNINTEANTETTAPSMREPVPSPSMPKSVASCDAPHAPRRTTRSLHTPAYLQDDKYNLTNLHSSTSVASSSHRQQHSLASLTTNHDSVCFTSFCPDSQQLVENISHDCEPCSYEEAILSTSWQKAMTQEFEALYANNTWELILLPKGKK